MGKKAKLGKKRKDKFYHLAKETGYRARSAFKLIQLNRKFQFLQQSRVLIDLCAAPGGWLQVASKYMPVSSIIIGIDLVPIKPINNVITIESDITVPKCKQLLSKELKQWKADCVLNDGAPNVGTAWIQDAFTQAQLTLSALKLATEFLRPGGWFVTKVFRSKDYQSLLTVLQKLFTKVHATKPQASRSESAEIFIVCKGYLIKGKPDPKLLDPKFVFEEVEDESNKPKMTLQRLQKPSKNAEGYPEGQHILHQSLPVIDFITSENHMELLASASKLIFDRVSKVFEKHPLTTEDIKRSCEDIRVLGLRELKQLIKWKTKMKEFIDKVDIEDDNSKEGKKETAESDDEELDFDEIDAQVKQLTKEEAAEMKRILRHKRKQKKKALEKLSSEQDDGNPNTEKEKMFSLETIPTSRHLKKMADADEAVTDTSDEENELNQEEEEEEDYYNLQDKGNGGSENNKEEENEQSDNEIDWEEEVDSYSESGLENSGSDEDNDDNPLMVDLIDKEMKKSQRTNQWFSNPAFSEIREREMEDEDEEINQSIKRFKGKLATGDNNEEDSENDDEDGLPTNIDDGKDDDKEVKAKKAQLGDIMSNGASGGGEKIKGLDPAGLAIGSLIVQSRKKKQELIDSCYNRWVHNDPTLPDWFMEDENAHTQKQLPITKDLVNEYRKKLKEINARPIKKIAEAKARKKRRLAMKLDKARAKAQVICEASDVTDQEKVRQIKGLYKKAGFIGQKKKEVQYVVAKKGLGKRVSRPAGVSGRFKVVDPRMKKDNRREKIKHKNSKKKGKKR